ncbi:MAG: hypothetical protein J6X58_03285 [Bacteroidales bacterium]|nr:hypothetical protein [Bacteroidales bacterium]
MTALTEKRQNHIDCAHGLMILHMMFYHLCGSIIQDTPYYYPLLHTFAFFMAWFFFKSGMFYKDRKIKEVLLLGLKRLVIPALIFSLIGFVCYLIAKRPETTFSNEIDYLYVVGAFRGIGPMWFLTSLYLVQIVYSLIFLINKTHKTHLNPAIIAVISFAWLFFNKYLGLRPLWAYNIPLGLLFYSLGHLFKELQYNRIVVIVCIVIYSGFYFIHTNIDFMFGRFKPFVIAIPWALAGCILINVLFKFIPFICVAPLRFFQKHAMEFLCTHMIIITIAEGYLQHNEKLISNVAFELIVFTAYLVVFSLILHFFKLQHIQWMFGRIRNKG